MRHLGTVVGSCIAGIFVMSVWGSFVGKYGIAGGWFAGLAIIGTMWLLNHYIGIINNDGAFVDMALGIGVAGTTKVMFLEGVQSGISAIPTLVVVVLGAAAGGFVAYLLEQELAKKNS